MSLIQRECHTATHNGKSPNSTKSVGGANGGVISATSLATPGSNGSSVGANGANGTHGANGANGASGDCVERIVPSVTIRRHVVDS